MVTKGRKWIYGLLAVFVVGIAIYYPYSPGGRQAMNMRVAAGFVPVLSAKIGNDPRFEDVRVGVWTGGGGSLMVGGFVDDESERADLRRIVLESFPPAPIAFMVQITPPTMMAGSTTQP